MADTNRIPGNLIVEGELVAGTMALPAACVNNAQVGAAAGIVRTKLAEDSGAVYRIPLQACRSNTGLVLDATGGDTLFSIANGGFGVGTLTLKGEEALSETETTTLCFECALPPEYIAGDSVVLAVECKVDESGAGNATVETIDAECYELADAGTVGSDLIDLAAQDMTGAGDVFATYTWTVDATGLAAGDKLIFYVRTIVTEDAGTAVFAVLGNIEVRLDIRG